jgi:plastocyanin
MRVAPLVACVVLAACGAEPTGGEPRGGVAAACTADNAKAVTYVTLRSMTFVPSCLKVATHAVVTFRNVDNILHSVTADEGQPGAFDSGPFPKGFLFQHVFDVAGVVQLHSRVQPEMRATVIVGP